MQRVLIVGGLGYLGGRLTEFLSNKGYYILITTRRKDLFSTNYPKNLEIVSIKYSSRKKIDSLMQSVDFLITLAGPDSHTKKSSYDKQCLDYSDLINQLIDSAKKNRVKKFIYLSTIHVYGKNLEGYVSENTIPLPIKAFAKTHLQVEQLILNRLKNTPNYILRCSNAFGLPLFENEKCWKLLVNNLCKNAFDQGVITINSTGLAYRNFIAVEDVLNAIHYFIKLNDDNNGTEIFNLGGKNTNRVLDIAKIIQEQIKKDFKRDFKIKTLGIKSKDSGLKKFTLVIDKIRNFGIDTFHNQFEIKRLIKYCKSKKYHLYH